MTQARVDKPREVNVSPPCHRHHNVHEMQREVPSWLHGNPIPMSLRALGC